MPEINIVKIDGKPLEKLIETVSAGIGCLYKPRSIRKQADAEAYKLEMLANAEAKANIIKNDTDFTERIKQRLYHQEVQRQNNLDSIIDISTYHLSKEVSEKQVDSDWRTRFFNKAQEVNTSEMQEIWGKILASEVNAPGNFSLRTLDLLSSLTKDEAILFTKFCGLCTEIGMMIRLKRPFEEDYNKYDISFTDILLLREIGLVDTSDNLQMVVPAEEIKTDVLRLGCILKFGKRGLVVSKEKSVKYSFDVYSLTRAGLDLFKIIYAPLSDEYFEDLKSFLEREKYLVQELRQVIRLKKKPENE